MLFSTEGEKNGDITLFLKGRIGLTDFTALFSEIKTLFIESKPAKLTVDFSQVEYFDSSGALFLVQLEDEAAARSVPFTIINVSAQQKQILSLVDREALSAPSLAPRERSLNLVEELGNSTMDILRDVYEVIRILGRACL